jgi:hypothetical protein
MHSKNCVVNTQGLGQHPYFREAKLIERDINMLQGLIVVDKGSKGFRARLPMISQGVPRKVQVQ